MFPGGKCDNLLGPSRLNWFSGGTVTNVSGKSSSSRIKVQCSWCSVGTPPNWTSVPAFINSNKSSKKNSNNSTKSKPEVLNESKIGDFFLPFFFFLPKKTLRIEFHVSR